MKTSANRNKKKCWGSLPSAGHICLLMVEAMWDYVCQQYQNGQKARIK